MGSIHLKNNHDTHKKKREETKAKGSDTPRKVPIHAKRAKKKNEKKRGGSKNSSGVRTVPFHSRAKRNHERSYI